MKKTKCPQPSCASMAAEHSPPQPIEEATSELQRCKARNHRRQGKTTVTKRLSLALPTLENQAKIQQVLARQHKSNSALTLYLQVLRVCVLASVNSKNMIWEAFTRPGLLEGHDITLCRKKCPLIHLLANASDDLRAGNRTACTLRHCPKELLCLLQVTKIDHITICLALAHAERC